ncbi:hypothetical protein BC940DRAFT_237054 [Gongronella butleri]|nr:hypothetical protein BC940DRAFT_237054 [Gongronella butleri]
MRVPLGTDNGSALDVALPSSENSWLGRADQQHLSEECHATRAKIMHDDPELETAFVVTTLVDSMRHLAQPLADAWHDKAATDAAAESAPQGPIAAIREWLWFPMIYTREKRGNITVSWSDIPAGHKKISTRWQQRFTVASMAELDEHRIFHDMQELIFEASGKFKNHNDLAMLKKWMNEHNVGEAFTYLFDYE